MVPQHLMLDIKYAITIEHRPHTSFSHVVAVIQDASGGFRLYDNDSQAAARGTYDLLTTQQVVDTRSQDAFFAILAESSELSGRLGPAITTLIHRGRRRARIGWGEILAQNPTQRRRER